MSRGDRHALAALLAATAVANVAYTVLIPLVPVLEDRFGMSAFAVGLAFGLFAFGKAVLQPAGGWAADRWAARPVALAGLTLAALAVLGLAFAGTATHVIAARLLWGVGEGIAIPALYRMCSAIGRNSALGESRAFGWFGSASVIGMAAGPALVGLLGGPLGFRGVFVVGAALTLLSAAMLLAAPGTAGARRTTSPARAPQEPTGRAETRIGAGIALAGLLFGLMDLLNNFVYAALEPVLPLYAGRHLGATESAISWLFFAGLVIFALMSAAAGPLAERRGPIPVMTAAFTLSAVTLAVMTATTWVPAFYAAFLALMIFQPVVYVCTRSLVARVSDRRQGTAFGVFGLMSDIGWVAGPLAGTALLETFGRPAFGVLCALTVLATALSAAHWLRERRGRPPAATPTATIVHQGGQDAS